MEAQTNQRARRNRDLRQLLWHRHRLVQMRTRVMNQLHVVALNEGLRRKKALWWPTGRKETIALAPWGYAATPGFARLIRPADAEDPGAAVCVRGGVQKRPVARLLMTHPGVGLLTALAALLHECMQSHTRIELDTADIVRDRDVSPIISLPNYRAGMRDSGH